MCFHLSTHTQHVPEIGGPGLTQLIERCRLKQASVATKVTMCQCEADKGLSSMFTDLCVYGNKNDCLWYQEK